ncbi:MAG TPA: hypothetical protein VFA38_07075 [Nitrospirales bacterium]|nr:hypothetical protein [Nitrospirales bacterium]
MRVLRTGESAVTERIVSNVHAVTTGIALELGVLYQLSVVEIDGWQDGHQPCDANGHDVWYLRLARFKRRVPEANWLALMGAIDDGEPFLIGMSRTYTPTRSGQLICFANDAGFGYGNNKGWLKLQIRRP